MRMELKRGGVFVPTGRVGFMLTGRVETAGSDSKATVARGDVRDASAFDAVLARYGATLAGVCWEDGTPAIDDPPAV